MDEDAVHKVLARDVLSRTLGKRGYVLPWTFRKVPKPTAHKEKSSRASYSKMQKAMGFKRSRGQEVA
jgi:hypothetical protein